MKVFSGITVFLISLSLIGEVLPARDVIKLKKAGVKTELLSEIIKSNAIYRALITIEGVVEMKKAGVTDEDILAIIKAGNPTVSDSVKEDRKDYKLDREIERRDKIIALQSRELDVLRNHLLKLMNNKEVLSLVERGKISSSDYKDIVKYLKQYARDEDTDDSDDGDDIEVNIKSDK